MQEGAKTERLAARKAQRKAMSRDQAHHCCLVLDPLEESQEPSAAWTDPRASHQVGQKPQRLQQRRTAFAAVVGAAAVAFEAAVAVASATSDAAPEAVAVVATAVEGVSDAAWPAAATALEIVAAVAATISQDQQEHW